MLDDENIIKQRDHSDALGVAAHLYEQVAYECQVEHAAHDGRPLTRVIVAGMGGSALAADLA